MHACMHACPCVQYLYLHVNYPYADRLKESRSSQPANEEGRQAIKVHAYAMVRKIANIGAYTLLGVPYCKSSIMGPQTLF